MPPKAKPFDRLVPSTSSGQAEGDIQEVDSRRIMSGFPLPAFAGTSFAGMTDWIAA
jgi:hypothetical protein